MARGRGSASVLPILVVLLSVGVGAVMVAWWPLTDVFGDSTTVRTSRATATVVRSVPCAERGARDLVELSLDGRRARLRFDGCGHSEGTELRVRVPEPLEEDAVARRVTTGAGAGGAGAEPNDRISRVLLALAALSGAGYVLLLRSGGERRPD
ncbi:hypothetical protein SAMN04487905_11050 [Actinopolyspora xinjiangensis]|uniref:Uncharacterized protein n=1 Tax=Actinopolyspora xinjiangensis TaxID=405564 RepID=A0A1H0VZX3_9ACTN|nr:hypothetical protein [Actinopolyspora xinjiangensis]SDP83805.1 hypothetical protein SAMN04487905_11050 [Actinopolyspora xinjiangensis]